MTRLIGVVVLLLVAAPAEAVTSIVGGYPFPSLDDERRTYDRFGWTRTASDEPAARFSDAEPGYSCRAFLGDVHGGTEADDLWTNLQQYRRAGLIGYRDRMEGCAEYWRSGQYLTDLLSNDGGHFLDHSYVTGALAYYELTGDTTLRTAAFAICNEVRDLWQPDEAGGSGQWSFKTPGQTTGGSTLNGNMGDTFSMRGFARNLLALARCYEHDPATYQAAFFQIAALWAQAPNFVVFGPSGGGLYPLNQSNTDLDTVCNTGAHASGIRVQGAFHQGLLGEALFHAYRVLPDAQSTLRNQVRAKLVAMGRFARDYGLALCGDAQGCTGAPAGNQNTGTYYGVNISTGVRAGCKADQEYSTISQVNLLTLAAWFSASTTEQAALLAKAKDHLDYGTRWKQLGSYGVQGEVDHFLDTHDGTSGCGSGIFFCYNKGELQYAWAIFAPFPSTTVQDTGTHQTTVLGAIARTLAPGEWAVISPQPTNIGAALGDGNAGGSGHKVGFAITTDWDAGLRRMWFSGSDHPEGATAVTYDDRTNTFSTHTPPWSSPVQHGYDHGAVDVTGRRFYHRPFGSSSWQRCDISTDASCASSWSVAFTFNPGDSAVGSDYVPWRASPAGAWVLHYGFGGSTRIGQFDIAAGTFSEGVTVGGGAGASLIECAEGPPHLCYLGKETTTFLTVDKADAVVTRASAPCSTYEQESVSTVDPVTGQFVLLCSGSVHAYDPATNLWTQLSGAALPQQFVDTWSNGAVVGPIATYGVIMVWGANGGTDDASKNAYIFKRAEMLPQGLEPPAGGPSPPLAPAGLSVR